MKHKEEKEINQKEEAIKLLQKEREKRQVECAQEVNTILKKHNCRLDVAMILREGKPTITQTKIVSN